MRIVAYLKQSKVAVFLIVLLLIVQAFADLSLPRYTSDLVDVGIRQGGITVCYARRNISVCLYAGF